jgi:hypothetical protein
MLRYNPRIFLKGLRKTTKNLSHDSRYPCQNLDSGPPERDAGVFRCNRCSLASSLHLNVWRSRPPDDCYKRWQGNHCFSAPEGTADLVDQSPAQRSLLSSWHLLQSGLATPCWSPLSGWHEGCPNDTLHQYTISKTLATIIIIPVFYMGVKPSLPREEDKLKTSENRIKSKAVPQYK